jgi:cytochrome b561
VVGVKGQKMQWGNSQARYGAVPQTIHWLTVIFIGVGWLLGWFMDDFSKAARPFVLFTHMTLGQFVIALLVIRLIWRFADPPPPPEKTRFGRLHEVAAKLSHYALYALLLAVPFAGIVVQLKRGNALPIFGLWNFTSPWPADRSVARSVLRAHEYLANALVLLAGVHATAALMHHWLLRDRTLMRMLPGAKA